MSQGKRNDPTFEPSDTDCAYAAGFIDGEGCVTVRAQRRVRNETKGWNASAYVIVVVSQVDPRPLQWMQQRWGGSLRMLKRRRKPNERDAWEWGISARQAIKLLHDVRPWLHVKGESADNALRLDRHRPVRGHHNGLTDEELGWQREVVAEARRLNQLRRQWDELPSV